MSTETLTVVSLDPESSRDGTKHWWILQDAVGRKYKVWEKPVADALKSLAAGGPVEVDIRPATDPKYFPSVTAARPVNGVQPPPRAYEIADSPVQEAPAPEWMTPESSMVLADFMRELSAAASKAEVRLRDLGIPF